MDALRNFLIVIFCLVGIALSGQMLYSEYRLQRDIETVAERSGCLAAAHDPAILDPVRWRLRPGSQYVEKRDIVLGECLRAGLLLKSEILE